MTDIIGGLREDDCDTLHQFEAEVEEFIEARRQEYQDEFVDGNTSDERLEELSEEIRKARELKSTVGVTRFAGCGYTFETPETDGDAELPCDDLDEFHEDVDEMIERVSETVPDYIYRDDAAYQELQSEENKKVIFQDGGQEVKDRVREFDDDCGIEETTTRNARAAQQVECITPPWEDRGECLESYGTFDTRSSGLTRDGEIIP